MTVEFINAKDVSPPIGGYSQAAKLSNFNELLFISGQIPTTLEGNVPSDPLEQAHQIWRNIDAQLRAADMSKADIVKVTIFLSGPEHIAAYREARTAYLDGHEPGLTCVFAGIFDSDWVMEIEAIAAR